MDGAARTIQTQLIELFGSYKAEWLNDKTLFDLFTEPDYLPELTINRPCVLIGGRGTGKTTALRGLSYEGRLYLNARDAGPTVASWPYYGIYYRVNTNRVTAFQGPEVSEERWIRIFGHYMNLLLCELTLRFLDWYEVHAGPVRLGPSALQRVADSLHLGAIDDRRDLAMRLDSHRIRFEAYVNNVGQATWEELSMQGAPIDLLFESLRAAPEFSSQSFFFLIDEYENFLPYQQRSINTLIKQSAPLYAFKIGVKELGLRQRTTLNPEEQLNHPADYVRINLADRLADGDFEQFARRVCEERLSRVIIEGEQIFPSIDRLLPGISEDEEALRLGVEDSVGPFRAGLEDAVPDGPRLSPLQLYLVLYWAEAHQADSVALYREWRDDPTNWETRFGNYKHALLYTIKRRKRGIRKYYAGWRVFTELAGGNIRYLLALVDQSLRLEVQASQEIPAAVSVDRQTTAAQEVGRSGLADLEGLTVHGAQLTRLLLGLGRVFQLMASEAERHAPEVNQFHVLRAAGGDAAVDAAADELLHAAVMHQALVRAPGSKPADEADTRAYDYSVHPIYSAFFVFSYRRKRKMQIEPSDIVEMAHDPSAGIRRVLARSGRVEIGDDLPEQLHLFESYYRER